MGSGFEQIGMPGFPPPPIVERIWVAKDRHYASGTSHPFDRHACHAQLQRDLGESNSLSTIDRARRTYPHLIPNWPIRRDQQRPWLQPLDGVPVAPIPDDAPVIEIPLRNGQVMKAAVCGNGFLRVIEHGLCAVAAGMIAAVNVLDIASDGKADHIIRWCEVLLAQHPHG